MERTMDRTSLLRKLYLLYALNVADWLCTVTLLHTGDFYEANPLMSHVVGSIPLGFLFKCVLPAVLMAAVFLLSGKLNRGERVWVDSFVSFVVVVYTAICVVHIIDFILWNSGI